MIKMYPQNAVQLTSSDIIRNYIYGGRGIVKLKSPSGNEHHYMFQKPLEKDSFPDDVIFVYAVHDQEKKFYIGMIENNQFRLTRHSRFLPDNDIVKGAFFIMNMMKSQSLVDNTQMELYHMGICARCGRRLESEKALKYGIGRKCMQILNRNSTETTV